MSHLFLCPHRDASLLSLEHPASLNREIIERHLQFRNSRAQFGMLSDFLLQDEDDMVRKGLGWLLRETAKADPRRTVPYLMKIGSKAPRLVLRTACETLPEGAKKKILQT